MVAIQIRDVPDEARDALTERARSRGQSLQAFLREVVLREAAFGHNVAVLDGIASWRTGSAATGEDVLGALDDARARRPDHDA
jgi:plasmid stability protein